MKMLLYLFVPFLYIPAAHAEYISESGECTDTLFTAQDPQHTTTYTGCLNTANLFIFSVEEQNEPEPALVIELPIEDVGYLLPTNKALTSHGLYMDMDDTTSLFMGFEKIHGEQRARVSMSDRYITGRTIGKLDINTVKLVDEATFTQLKNRAKSK